MLFLLRVFLLCSWFVGCCSFFIDLASSEWTLQGAYPNGTSILVPATVPGDAISDLLAAGLIGDPLEGQGDLDLRWISEHNWNYSTQLILDKQHLQDSSMVLVLYGLDTIASVYVNDRLITNNVNMWHEHYCDIKWQGRLNQGKNSIQIRFTSSVQYAKEQQQQFLSENGFTVPPDGPPTLQNGFDHANFIRKMQSSFSWDWGPAFPSAGIWRDIHVKSTSGCLWHRLSAVPVLNTINATWTVHINMYLWCASNTVNGTNGNIDIHLSIPDTDTRIMMRLGDMHALMNHIQTQVHVADRHVKRWWPRQYGQQHMYTLNVSYLASGHGSTQQHISSLVAFRTVELVQDPVKDSQGTQTGETFYLKVNRVPIFLKGTNWIPASLFANQPDIAHRRTVLFDSMVSANMNALRLWGGGVFEHDQFYELADQMGLMVWHDMMFACALYPTNKDMLAAVRKELVDQLLVQRKNERLQISRIQSHPSIVVWAGNNENELALVQHWYSSLQPMATQQQYRDEYMQLYNETVWKAINDTDHNSRPFLLSSPSNGLQTVREGGISSNPGNPLYGDVHVYDYYSNAWLPWTLPHPRCATEYGYQSYPAKATLLPSLGAKAQWLYFGVAVMHRQHHATGNIQMLAQVFAHFMLPPYPLGRVDSDTFMDAMVYLSQAHQAMAYRTETEHYRRLRNVTEPSGHGQCMCALYWQLNDVWPAPTWASVDYQLTWKMAHYYARRFFAELLVSILYNQDQTALEIHVINDRLDTYNDVHLQLEAFTWAGGFDPIWKGDYKVNVPALSSSLVLSLPCAQFNGSMEQLVFRAVLVDNGDNRYNMDVEGEVLTDESWLHTDKMYRVPIGQLGRVKAVRVLPKANQGSSFTVHVKADRLAPFVWLETKLLGNFSDNGMLITRPDTKVTFTCFDKGHCSESEFKSSLTVITLADIYHS